MTTMSTVDAKDWTRQNLRYVESAANSIVFVMPGATLDDDLISPAENRYWKLNRGNSGYQRQPSARR